MPTKVEHEWSNIRGRIASELVKKAKSLPHVIDGNNIFCNHRRRLEHPQGVKPIGNYFEDIINGIVECRTSGLGRLSMLQDIHVLSLLNYLSALDLLNLAASSRAAYVYATHDELWRVLVLEELHAHFKPERTWKATYLKTKYGDKSFFCAAAPIEETWLVVESIERRNAKNMTLDEFKRDFEGPNVPVIITNAIDNWAAMDKWTDEYLSDVCKGTTFYAGGFQFPMDEYLNYARVLQDDQPLFIFDKKFAAKVPRLAKDYMVPEYFREDYFALLDEKKRPDYRWLIIGPKKSGSSFHIDPNATNAWNGVIRGSKKWIMFPPGQVPPGIHPSEDGSEVSTPVSMMEWFVTFYNAVQKLPAHLKPLEGICRKGETIFVPHGWWHTVLNIEESIAVTQNFVSSGNVKSVMRFLTEKPEQVSGCPMEQRAMLGEMLRDVMAKHVPEVFAKVDKELQEENKRKHRKTKWKILISKGSDKKERPMISSIDGIKPVSSANTFGFDFRFD
ncbi:unnamed protein product [Peronospora belbahrii]|uniref:JmjC domain-containing protein n=1 Tax=Peronospora belbahrii TaxID=622444 RepID=A0AAU9KTI6_9STRA|nr:unnamed protein product [Peronospora belbahrii]